MKSYQQLMQDLAEKDGHGRDLRALSAGQYRKYAIAVRPAKQKLKDGASAVISRGMTSVGLRVVPAHVAAENERTCRSCPDGQFLTLRNGEPACNACQCSNKYLRAKWRDAKRACVRGHWNNRRKQSYVLKEPIEIEPSVDTSKALPGGPKPLPPGGSHA